MTSKKQFLDPIGTGCKLILLHFTDPDTKIRIIDHTIQLVPNNLAEKLLYRPLNGDSRNDIAVLYPVIIRFVELYLTEENSSSAEEHDKHKHKSNKQNDPKKIVDEKCHESLKKMAKYIIAGLSRLGATYGFDNAAIAIHYYSIILTSAVEGTYSNKMLPDHLKDLTHQNLLDTDKIKNIWKNETIIELIDLFEKCFDAYEHNNLELVNGFRAGIDTILALKDEAFKKIVLSTDNA